MATAGTEMMEMPEEVRKLGLHRYRMIQEAKKRRAFIEKKRAEKAAAGGDPSFVEARQGILAPPVKAIKKATPPTKGAKERKGEMGEEVLASFEEEENMSYDPLVGGSSQYRIPELVEPEGDPGFAEPYDPRASGIAKALGLPGTEPEPVDTSLYPEQYAAMAGAIGLPGSEVMEESLRLEAVDSPPGVNIPRQQLGDTGQLPSIVNDMAGYQKQINALARQRDLLRQEAAIQSKLIEGRRDYGTGKLETVSEARERIRLGQDARRSKLMEEQEGYLGDARLSAKYPGLDLDEIKGLQETMGRELNPADYKDPQEFVRAKRRHIAEQASAKSKLNKATKIQTEGPFGNIASKIVAALSIGAGAQAAAMGGGRNVALDLYNKSIDRDIAAQREAFAHKRAAPGKAQKEYAFLMRKLGDEEAAAAGTLAIKYEQAVGDLKAKAAKFPALLKAEGFNVTLGGLQQKAADAKRASQIASRKAVMAQDSGYAGVKWVGGTKHGMDKQDPGDKKKIQDVAVKSATAKGAINRFKDALSGAKFYSLPLSAKHAQLSALREDLIATLGGLWEKGVLQEFEREQIEAIIPGKYPSSATAIEGFTGRINAGLTALNDAAEGKLEDVVGAFTQYEYIPEKRKTSWIRTTGEKGKL